MHTLPETYRNIHNIGLFTILAIIWLILFKTYFVYWHESHRWIYPFTIQKKSLDSERSGTIWHVDLDLHPLTLLSHLLHISLINNASPLHNWSFISVVCTLAYGSSLWGRGSCLGKSTAAELWRLYLFLICSALLIHMQMSVWHQRYLSEH